MVKVIEFREDTLPGRRVVDDAGLLFDEHGRDSELIEPLIDEMTGAYGLNPNEQVAIRHHLQRASEEGNS